MQWRVKQIERDMRVFPTVGRVRMTFVLQDDRRVQVDFTISQVDFLAQLLMQVAQSGRELGTTAGHAHTLQDADLATSFPVTDSFRLMPLSASGHLGIQLAVPGVGLMGLALAPEQASLLSRQIPEQLQELEAARRPKS
jgi:hypothetical protein